MSEQTTKVNFYKYLTETETFTDIKGRIMCLAGGSPAYHKLGDIGREEDDYIRVFAESEHYYQGVFEEGFGFINVRFPKVNVKPLTQEQINDLNGKYYSINGRSLYVIKLDNDGYFLD